MHNYIPHCNSAEHSMPKMQRIIPIAYTQKKDVTGPIIQHSHTWGLRDGVQHALPMQTIWLPACIVNTYSHTRPETGDVSDVIA